MSAGERRAIHRQEQGALVHDEKEFYVRVTSRGRVTISSDIRQQLGIQPGSDVRFILQDGYAILEKGADGKSRGRSGAVKP